MMNRRGIFFTIIAVLLAGFAIVTILAVTKTETNGHSVQTRIATLDNFLTDTKKDFDRALAIGGFRALLSLEDYMVDQGVFINDLPTAFASSLMNASYNGVTLPVVENATLNDWQSRIEAQANLVGLSLNVELKGISFAHTTPWEVEVTANATLTLTDNSGLASFSANHTGRAKIPITGFEDPVYLLNTYGRVTNIINETPYTDFIVGNNTANLLDHITNGFYYAHNDSPSFLLRMQGLMNASPYGIESLVNISTIELQDVPTHVGSAVDYLYFRNTSTSNSPVDNTPGWFLLDSTHLLVYN